EFTIPTAGSLPHAITAGPDNNLWFTETPVNSRNERIGQMSTNGRFLAEFYSPTVSGNPIAITVGPHGTVWFAENGANKIGVVHEVLSSNDAFVQSLYQNALGRLASPTEISAWVNVLVQRGTGPIIAGIQNSPEARTHLVKSWYITYLGRQARGGEEQAFANQ